MQVQTMQINTLPYLFYDTDTSLSDPHLSAYALVSFQSFLAPVPVVVFALRREKSSRSVSLFRRLSNQRENDALSCPFDSSRTKDEQQRQQRGGENMEEM